MANEDGEMSGDFERDDGQSDGDDFDSDVDHEGAGDEQDTLQSPQVIHTGDNVLLEQDMDAPDWHDGDAAVPEHGPGAMSNLFSTSTTTHQ